MTGYSRHYRLSVLVSILVLLGVPAWAGSITIQGTLLAPDGKPVTGSVPYQVQFFSNNAGGTPLGPVYDGATTLTAEGKFAIPASAPDPSDMAPTIWFSLAFDADHNGFGANDEVTDPKTGKFKVGDPPLAVKLPSAPAAATPLPPLKPGKVTVPSPLPANCFFNVMDFGAAGDGLTDDTPAIQAAIDAAKANKGAIVYLPAGRFAVTSLNMTNAHNFAFVGASTLSTMIYCAKSDVHTIDLTGAMYLRLENFSMHNREGEVPLTALFLGQNANWSANAMHFMSVGLWTSCKVASVYVFGCQSSDFMNCDFYNFNPSAAPVVVFTMTNFAKLKSEFATINPAHTGVSDWSIVSCEIHSFAAKAGSSQAPAVVLDCATQMRWFGGNISGSGPMFVKMMNRPTMVAFYGTTFYSDNGTPAKNVFWNVDTIDGLTCDQCTLNATDAIFGADPGATWKNVQVTGPAGQARYFFNSPKGNLLDSNLHCNGMDLAAGTINKSTLIDPGKVVAERYDGPREITLADGAVETVAGLPSTGILTFAFTGEQPGDNQRWGLLSYQQNQKTATLGGGLDWEHLAPADKPTTGTLAAGKIGFQCAASEPGKLFIHNRMGRILTIRLAPFSAARN